MPADSSRYSPRRVWAWALYDFANSAFTTLVVTFIYATYFTGALSDDATTGTGLWSIAVASSALLVAVLSPFAGALADQGGLRKRFMLLFTVVSVAGTVALFFPRPGDAAAALALFVVANVAFEMGIVFNNAYLPDIAPPERIGRVSGYGWGLGYVGGLLCLVIALVVFVQNPALLGLDTETYEHVRATNLLVAGWFALFSLPAFFVLPEVPRRTVAGTVAGAGAAAEGSALRRAWVQFVDTFREIRRYRQIVRLLVARLFYNDGLVTVIAFGAIYAEGVFGFTTEKILLFGIVLNVAAGTGSAAFGVLDDRLGGRTLILITLVGLFGASLLAVVTASEALFWTAGAVIGLLLGPNQSASRSLMGRFVPRAQETEFYGFFAFSGKATAFLGPAALGWVTTLLDSQRAGVAVVLVFFLVGGLLLLRVDEREGVALARSGAGA